MEIVNDFKLCCLLRAKKKEINQLWMTFSRTRKSFITKTCLALNTYRPTYILIGTSRLNENNKPANIQKLQ